MKILGYWFSFVLLSLLTRVTQSVDSDNSSGGTTKMAQTSTSELATAETKTSNKVTPQPPTDIAVDGDLPQCSQMNVVTGTIHQKTLEVANMDLAQNLRFKMSLHQTACFHVQLESPANASIRQDDYPVSSYNNSFVYSISYSRLEHHYPIWQRYEFGIPEIRSECVCDCAGGDDHCTPALADSRTNCSQSSDEVCVHTFHAHKQATGCLAGAEADVCCRVHLRPHKNWRFLAVNLGRANYLATFVYRLHSLSGGRRWRVVQERAVQLPLNQLQTFDFDSGRMQLKISGAEPLERLPPGGYFTFANETRLRVGVPVNSLHERDLGKLGWFRRDESKNRWAVRKAQAKIGFAHKVSVVDCKAQRYVESFLGEHFVLRASANEEVVELDSFHLGETIDEREIWVGSVSMRGTPDSVRHIDVVHRGQHHTDVDLTLRNMPVPSLLKRAPHFDDFDGRIQLDRFSNRFLNVTFLNASGTLIGSSYTTNVPLRLELAFSCYVGAGTDRNHSEIIDLPPSVDGARRVCFHPAGSPELEKCRNLKFESSPLRSFEVPYGWSVARGECAGCNEIGVDNFVQYLDPREWLNGLSSTSETLAFSFEIVVYVVVGLLIAAIIKKCVWPLGKCLFCSSSGATKK